MKKSFQAVMAAAALVAAGHAAAQITLYEGEGFRGRAITANGDMRNLDRSGMNDRVSSIVVERGRWEVCEHARFEGRCVVLRRGNYPSLREFGLDNQISSVRMAGGNRRYEELAPPVAATEPVYEWRRRADERVSEVPVTSVRAVMGTPTQRCWVERQQVAQDVPSSNQSNLGGALIGGLVGGILGHQVGGGTGKDLATAGGAVAGAVVGSNMANNGYNSNSQVVSTRDVQRCDNVPNQAPAYYDVVYIYNGAEHHVQMQNPPGRTIPVNGRGEPRM